MELILNNDKEEIERTLGLDAGTLDTEDGNYYTAEIDGDARVGIYVKPLGENKILITAIHHGDDELEVCGSCGGLYPNTEMREENNYGYLCDGCIAGIKSRGERLKFKE